MVSGHVDGINNDKLSHGAEGLAK